MHNTERVESYKLDTSKMSHGGGDQRLMKNFLNIMKGVGCSVSSLNDGLLSALMCIKANESASTDTFQKIEWPD